MRSLLFIILAGYAVRCNDASYYVIEMPEEALREYNKPFRVYWNVPTKQCRSKRIPFEGLFDKFGIIQNSGDSFRGEKVSILYDPGLFPALLKNETSGKFKFRNGGVPQEGDLEKHLFAFRNTLEQSVPDENFSGVGIIDFESWRPVFRQNFGVLIPYKDISYQIERKLHWFWTERAIQAKARERFEEAGRAFMEATLQIAKQMRPRGLWGYYGFPYCFNMATNNMAETCSDKVKQENDKTHWLWSESTALFPSVYSSKSLSTSQLVMMVRGRVAEAARVARGGAPVLPYFWFRYRDGGFMSQTDLDAVIKTLYKSKASGFIIWGSSNDVNTVDKCNSLLQYTEEVLGPAIAKYTKAFDQNISYPVSNFGLTTWRPILRDHLHNSTTSEPTLDPEYHWIPPENYTQDIVHYVDQELKKRPSTTDKDTNETSVKKNLLIEMIFSIFKNNKEVIDNNPDVKEVVVISDETKSQNEDERSTTVFSTKTNYGYNLESSTTIAPQIVTQNLLISLLKDKKKGTPNRKHDETDVKLQETSNHKFDSTTSTTTLPTTRSYVSFTEKYNESSENMAYNTTISQENMTTTNEPNMVTENDAEILSELIEIGTDATSVTIDSQENTSTTTESNTATESEEEISDELIELEAHIKSLIEESTENTSTTTKPNTVTENEDEMLSELLEAGANTSVRIIERSTEVSKSSTFESTDNITESNLLNSYEVTNTSQDYTGIPFDEVTSTLSTTSETHIVQEDYLSHTPSNILEITSSDIPDTSKNYTNGNVRETALGINHVSSTHSETVDENFSTESESSTKSYRDAIYDYTLKFSEQTEETEEIPSRDNIINMFNNTNSAKSKERKEGELLGKYNQSTNTAPSLSTDNEEQSSTTEVTALTKTDVPDVEKEGFRIEEVTESMETTTDEQEVVVL
ncbi:hypothetical protein ABMA27_009704 [Loxostege sticticalis]|uniref:Hyaluronidase n=1 Tax=Loxostege sticticalis TaxID=481309 RepID=A0ABR3H651_LOXSC